MEKKIEKFSSTILQKKMEKKEKTKMKEETTAGAGSKEKMNCEDRTCHVHGKLKVRGRTFKGTVIRKFPRRVTIEFERMIYVRKYERYSRSKTKIHARLPKCMEDMIQVGDIITVQECRPLSKIIHFAVTGKIKEAEAQKQ